VRAEDQVHGTEDATEVRVPVLMYHSIADESSARFRPYAVRPADFAAHLDALHDTGYSSLSMAEYNRLCAGPAGDWPQRPVVVTFDDAFLDFHDTALPMLAEHGFTATLFVPTRYVGETSRWLWREGEDDRAMMTWSTLLEASSADVEIGSHTQSHPQLDLVNPGEARREITDSKHILEQQLQRPVESFAYPFGYSNRTVRRLVRDAGYLSACAVRDLTSSSRDDPFAVSRWTVPAGMGADELLSVLELRTGRRSQLRSDLRASASHALRRLGIKRRGETRGDT
jgi:peptidoglycan/xylan/chitin deacetylase (PgdA/CDA1 family)